MHQESPRNPKPLARQRVEAVSNYNFRVESLVGSMSDLRFSWVKQHLRIKRFFGTSENAVKSQVWIAVAVYVLVAIIRKRLDLEFSLHSMLQILSVTPFEKAPLFQLLTDMAPVETSPTNPNQMILL